MIISRMALEDVVPEAREWLRRSYARLITSGAQVLLLFIGAQLQSRMAWLLCLGLVAFISVLAWLSALYRLRTLRNTPVSTVASAAQGYVELSGRGQHFCDPPLYSQLRGRPCLWCRYLVEEEEGDEWRTVDRGETSASFMLRDHTGECVVDPESAEIVTRHKDRWTDQNMRYTEWVLIEQDVLRVVGQFRTQGGASEPFDTRAELGEMLAAWKQDMPRLLARYDLDRDGLLLGDEWESVRCDALRAVVQLRTSRQQQPETHLVGRPPDGALFLISNMPHDKLLRRYLLWGWAHLALFFAALSGMAWVARNVHS
ncbi:hypothetical protein [Rhodoferax lacus]|nr:hypothetical protein [Rhodoferax lacus]